MTNGTGKDGGREILTALRRRWMLIVASAVIAAVAAGGYSALQPSTYEASAGLLFRDPGFDQTLFGASYLAQSNDPARQAATNLRLVRLGVVARQTARALRQKGIDLNDNQVKDKVSVRPQGDSDVIAVAASDENPRTAAILANTFAGQYVVFRREADRQKIDQAIELIRRQLQNPGQVPGTDRESLEQRIEQLGVLASLQTGNAELVQPAEIPEQPAGPRTTRNIAVGGSLGLLVGLLITLASERLDRRVRDEKQLEELTGLPVLGSIPRAQELSQRSSSTDVAIPVRVAEDFRLLRARLRYFNVDHDLHTLLVTSASAGEGKSTVSWLLTLTTALAQNARVVLIEADLRRPTLAQHRGLSPAPGLAEVLSGGASFDSAVQMVFLGRGEDGQERSADVLTAGAPPPNPAELLESQRMQDLLSELDRHYDIVLIDTPPALVVSDSLPLIRRADGVIVVARLGVTRKDGIVRLRRELGDLGASVLGVVANGANVQSADYYGYAPYQSQAQPPDTTPSTANAEK